MRLGMWAVGKKNKDEFGMGNAEVGNKREKNVFLVQLVGLVLLDFINHKEKELNISKAEGELSPLTVFLEAAGRSSSEALL